MWFGVVWCLEDGSQVPMVCLYDEEARVACDERKWIPRGTCSGPLNYVSSDKQLRFDEMKSHEERMD